MKRILLLLTCFLMTLKLEASYLGTFNHFLGGCDGYRFSLGPEFYHSHRKRAGGSWQEGYLYGGEARCDYVSPNRFYYCARGEIASGTMSGYSAGGSELQSDVTEEEIEGRIGFTFAPCWDHQPLLIPFVGYGYFCEKNNFVDPSPLPIHFRNSSKYVSWGFCAEVPLDCSLTFGANFIWKYFLDCRSRVTNDPFIEDFEIQAESETQFEFELPMTYQSCFEALSLKLVPFYKYRRYGGRESFPFDFIDTQFNIFGARFLFTYEL